MSVEIIGVSEKDAPLTLIGKIAGTSTDKSDSGNPVKRAKSCIKRGHMSVAEFVTVTFSVTGSRAMTHQLVRHRLASFCQLSQRYVKLNTDDMGWYVTPPSIDECGEKTPSGTSAKAAFEEAMASAALQYKNLLAAGVRPEDARYVLPNACETTIRVSMNLRELQSFYKLRSDKHAQWEIRDVAEDIKTKLLEYTSDSDEWQELISLLLVHEEQK